MNRNSKKLMDLQMLNPVLAKEIAELISLSNDCKDTSKALDIKMQAWDLIPKPATQFLEPSVMLAFNISRGFGKLGNLESQLEWALIGFEAGKNFMSASYPFWVGQIYYDSGNLEKAYYYFDLAFDLDRRKPFTGQDKYFQFYIKEKHSRNALNSHYLNGKLKVDKYNLERFVTAQQSVYPQVVKELKNGKKTSHWMWFIFPQIQGLGYSSMAQKYAITSLEEAAAYLAHPVLGQRLIELCEILLGLEGKSAHAIFGSPDDMKLHSSLTLFSLVPNSPPIFGQLLDKYFDGKTDGNTERLLNN